MSRWTFVTSHGVVLALIARYRQITTRGIASELDLTKRSVHRIFSEMEAEGYIKRKRTGRPNWYEVNPDLPLRRPEARDIAVGELIRVLNLTEEVWAGG